MKKKEKQKNHPLLINSETIRPASKADVSPNTPRAEEDGL
jgi:hypothetical protein